MEKRKSVGSHSQRPRSHCLPFDRRASSTSTRLYTSPYPLRTVLGVALPACSLLFLSINSLARCRSADSRFNRASSWEGGRSGSDVRDPLGGRPQPLRNEEVEDREDELASCELIDVSGSAFDLRFMSRILRLSVRHEIQAMGRSPSSWDTYLMSLSISSTVRPFPFSEYHGFKSFSDGARGTPLSVSVSGFLTFVDIIISCCTLVSALVPTARYDHPYLLQIFEQVDVALRALNHVRRPLTEQLFFLSFLLSFARLGGDTGSTPK